MPVPAQKKAPTEAGAGDALRRSVYTGYSKILPLSLTKRLPKLRIGGLRQKKAPTEAGAGDRREMPPAYSLGGSLSSGGLDGGLGRAHSGV